MGSSSSALEAEAAAGCWWLEEVAPPSAAGGAGREEDCDLGDLDCESEEVRARKFLADILRCVSTGLDGE
jgi:hypothetical protein